jgi:3',5'-cyclic AMP phosphodiesterase CpdA
MTTRVAHISDIHVVKPLLSGASAEIDYLKAYLTRMVPVAGAVGTAAIAAKYFSKKLDDPDFKHRYVEMMNILRDEDGRWDRRFLGGALLGLLGASAGLLYAYRREVMKLLASMHRDRDEIREMLLTDLEKRRPDVVLVTGDLTMVAEESEFALARDFLRRIGAMRSAPVVLAIPGNHDVQDGRRGETAARLDLYNEYMAEFMPGGRCPFVVRMGDAEIYGINSNTVGRGVGTDGRIAAAEMNFLKNELAAPRRRCRVVALHHHLRKYGREPRMPPLENSGELLAAAGEGNVALVAHGHKHALYDWVPEGDHVPHVQCAGSTTAMGIWRPKGLRYRIFVCEKERLLDDNPAPIEVSFEAPVTSARKAKKTKKAKAERG